MHVFRRMLAVASAAAVVSLLTASSAGAATYKVQTGDTLSGIARRHGVTVAALLAANSLRNPNVITTGTQLQIPTGSSAAPTPTTAAASWSGRYQVRRGDSFAAIARRVGTTAAALARANGLALTSVIRPGQILKVPGPAASAAPASATTPSTASSSAGLPSNLRADPVRLALVPVFMAAAREFGIPADLLMATAYRESNWQRAAVSSSGAIGIGQLMPTSAVWVASLLRQPHLDPYDPEDNIRMSAKLLSLLLQQANGDATTALAMYFQGPGSVRRDGISPTAQRYAADVMNLRSRFDSQ